MSTSVSNAEELIKFGDQEGQGFELNDVTIFEAGVWRGREWTNDHLDSMVQAFEKEKKNLKPFLKLGHDDNQKFLQSDGLPSAGWVSELKRVGNKLKASFKNVPAKIKKLIDAGRYGRFSSEIFINYTNPNGEKFPRALAAVALLGADTPELVSMDDLVDQFFTSHNYEEIFKMEGNMPDDNTAILEKFKKLEDQVSSLSAEVKEKDSQIKNLETEKEKFSEENAKFKQDLEAEKFTRRQNEVTSFVDEQIKSKKILPVQREKYIALCMDDQTEHKFSYIEDNKEQTVKGTNFSLVKEILGGMPELFSSEFDSNHQDVPAPEKRKGPVDPEDDKLNEAVEKYAKENNISYREAFDVVTTDWKGGK